MCDFTVIEAGTFVSADALEVVERIAITPIQLEENHLTSNLVVSLAERHLEQNLDYSDARVKLPAVPESGIHLVGDYELSLPSFILLRSIVGREFRVNPKGVMELRLDHEDAIRFLKFFRYKEGTRVLKGGIEALTEHTERRILQYRSLSGT